MNWASGDRLQSGQYIIERQLGEGGFGITYLAIKTSTNKKVVIKTLKREILNSSSYSSLEKEKYRQGFKDEALRLAVCRDRNIVEILETVFEENSLPWIVMEYIDGENLWDCVKRQGVLTEPEALIYVKQIGEALKVVHEKNLLHRDVSPSNIIIQSNSNDAKLIDFGIARPYISSKNSTSFHKDGFSPVEQYDENQEQGPYTDVYALAATLYYLLVGDPPPLAWVRYDSNKEYDSDNLVPPKDKNPNISDRVNQAILEGMAIKPTDRPNSVQEWLEMLGKDRMEEGFCFKNFSFDVVFIDVRGQQKSREQHHAELFEQVLNEDPFLRLEMVKIPQGSFLMGSPDLEMVKNKSQESKLNERPQHRVSVDSFFMSKYPITQAIWRFIANLPKVEIYLNPNCSRFQGDENPVEQVSWCQAVEFCYRLSKHTNLNYRLPSEAEWEYACRAGIDKKPFHFGDTITTKVANYDGTESYNYEPMGEYHQKTQPVGSFGVANAFGLYDMHGNVWEWCADPKHDNYIDAPSDSRSWELERQVDNTTSRVMRGGSWKTKAKDCRAANRRFLRPTRSDASNGFRVALNIHS
ncbi:MAG: SUMF1/EgtB/PvdO family nonheme iron enzyme [Trichodesmium sp.]